MSKQKDMLGRIKAIVNSEAMADAEKIENILHEIAFAPNVSEQFVTVWRVGDMYDNYQFDTREDALDWMLRNNKYFQERMCEFGFEAWDTYAQMDDLKAREEPEDA